MYKVVLLPEAKKFYKKLYSADRAHFGRICNVLQSLQSDPFQGKPLKHKLKGQYSLRVGSYRVVYTVEKRKVTVCVLDIGHRKNVYK